jgi:hypothetical protein
MARPSPASVPRSIPARPPVTDRTTDSTKNWVRIMILRAPTALRTPISLVLSVTLTSIMFMMPTPAARSAIALMMNAPPLITSAILAKAAMSESFE